MKIILSGGGTLGPVTPLLAIAAAYKKHDSSCRFLWVGTKHGPERALVEKAGVSFKPINSGKFRRYFSFWNISDLFRVCVGLAQSLAFLKKEKPDLLISAGGFVSVPLHWAASLLSIPTWVHQQDARPGLANKMMSVSAAKITTALKSGTGIFDSRKTEWIGNPCRDLRVEDRAGAKKFFNIADDEPVILAMGGGTGAAKLNSMVLAMLPLIPKTWHVVHLVGFERSAADCEKTAELFSNYKVYKFFTEEMALAYAAADVVISRAGFGSLSELASLAKPAIILPISDSHQEENAKPLAEEGAIVMLNEIVDTGVNLAESVKALVADPERRRLLGEKLHSALPVAEEEKIVRIITELTKTGA
jgi:UDP-N-acetylglucosamine--N-acetylmuramyl-(pentapeptide) pyrophosphoryl-undecaprenol N-acetylglucosamine transferase